MTDPQSIALKRAQIEKEVIQSEYEKALQNQKREYEFRIKLLVDQLTGCVTN